MALTLAAIASFPSLVLADTQQGGSYLSGERVKAGQLPGGYSESASYKCDNGHDLFFTADYIFWDWVQDAGMGIGVRNPAPVVSTTHLDIKPVTITPGYASGFQLGVGYNMKGMDDWNVYGEYTWYKNSGSKSAHAEAAITSPNISLNVDLAADISLKYDNADFLIERPFYFGKKLTANFYTGLKALWITREAKVTIPSTSSFTFLSSSFLEGTVTEFDLHDKVSSWSLGPKFGIDSSWLLGYGIKFLSNVSVSAVYTRYTQTLDGKVDGEMSLITLPVSLKSSGQMKQSNYGTIRPILETYLGLGWGSFFCENKFHFDLSVGYDFNVFWNYVTEIGGTLPPASMYLHGVNAQVRFDF
jgi:hypothetical protein